MKKCSICFSDFQKYQLEFNSSPCYQAHKAGAYPPVSVVLSGGESHNFQFFCCYRACSKSLKILPYPFDFYNMIICKDYWFYFLFIHAHVNLCMNVFHCHLYKRLISTVCGHINSKVLQQQILVCRRTRMYYQLRRTY